CHGLNIPERCAPHRSMASHRSKADSRPFSFAFGAWREARSGTFELVSEVWAKLIGSITMRDPNNGTERSNFPDPSEWTIDPHENDGRVVWLIREIGGPRALAHRCEDIRRRRWGRATPGHEPASLTSGASLKHEANHGRHESHSQRVRLPACARCHAAVR